MRGCHDRHVHARSLNSLRFHPLGSFCKKCPVSCSSLESATLDAKRQGFVERNMAIPRAICKSQPVHACACLCMKVRGSAPAVRRPAIMLKILWWQDAHASGLTRRLRRRGLLIALTYLACVIAPPVSLAFTDGAVAAHCLTEEHHVRRWPTSMRTAPSTSMPSRTIRAHHAKRMTMQVPRARSCDPYDCRILDQKQADSSKDTDKKAGGTVRAVLPERRRGAGVPVDRHRAARSILQPTLEAATAGLEPAASTDLDHPRVASGACP